VAAGGTAVPEIELGNAVSVLAVNRVEAATGSLWLTVMLTLVGVTTGAVSVALMDAQAAYWSPPLARIQIVSVPAPP
jgi:hypothetical protein